MLKVNRVLGGKGMEKAVAQLFPLVWLGLMVRSSGA